MALLPKKQTGLLPKPRTQLLPLDMGASVRAEAEGHRRRFGEPQGGYIPFPTMPTKEQIGQWALQNPLDAAALATSPLPVVGDVVGFAADAKALYDDPSWSNAGWMAAGLLPFVPAGTVKRVVGEGKKMYRGLGGAYDASKAGNYQMFTSSVDDAAEYARYGKDPTVVEAAIDRGNNLKISANGSNFNTISIDSLPGDVRAVLHPSIRESGIARTDDIAYAAQKAGYDSVTIDDVVDSRWGEKGSGKPVTVEAVFDPKRVTASNIDIPGSSSAKMTAEDDALLADLLGGPLPTDQASRMARAKEMGFHDQVLYHGTAFDIDGGFKPSEKGNAGPGVYLTSDPDVASTYANYPGAYSSAPNQYRDEGANVVAVRVRGNIAPFSEYGEVRKTVLSKNKNLKDQHIANNMIAEEIKKRGYDGFEHRGGTVVMFNPENIRSVHAQFDPAKKNSADLLAGIGAGGLLGLGAYNRLSAEEEY